ncbi:LemA family protein [Salibacterium aidingense]|uniref:LemA family protein n=1 Tax=Salibacterium aidingense TaxID=384933 RepID=UPI00040C7744|nr:LemA family protein [Salibacterium aidingense]
MSIFSFILGIAIIVALVCWIVGYNALIKFLSWVEEAWAQIDVQLQRRMDLIPPLIDTVQQYAKHEQQTLERVVELRSQLTSPDTTRVEQLKANDSLSKALDTLFALKEDNPELQQDEEFLYLEKNIQDADQKIQRSVTIYNNTVQKYNTKIHSIPANFVANVHNFKEREQLNLPSYTNKDIKLSS